MVRAPCRQRVRDIRDHPEPGHADVLTRRGNGAGTGHAGRLAVGAPVDAPKSRRSRTFGAALGPCAGRLKLLSSPERSGNRLTFGFQNILQTGTIGLIFVVPGVRETLRINGQAHLTKDPALLQRLAAGDKPALLATRIAVRECFFHCAKAFIRSGAWEPTSWRAGAAGSAAVRNWARLFGVPQQQVEEALEQDYRHNL